MRSGLLGKKLGMTRILSDDGRQYAVTVLKIEPHNVIAHKTADKHGYDAVVVGTIETEENKLNKPMRGFFKALGGKYYKKLHEFRVETENMLAVGSTYGADIFTSGQFVDVTGTIGRIAAMQDSFTLAWLKEKIFEQWGERTTLIHSIPKIMQTIRQLGAVESSGNAYTVVRNEIKDDQTKIILVKTILALKMKPYYEPSELTAIPQLCPFTYDLSTDVVFGSGAFEFGNFGGNHVLIS